MRSISRLSRSNQQTTGIAGPLKRWSSSQTLFTNKDAFGLTITYSSLPYLMKTKPRGKWAQPRVTTLFPTALKTKQSQPVSSRDLKQSKVYSATEGGCHLFLPPTNRHQTEGVGVGRERGVGNPNTPAWKVGPSGVGMGGPDPAWQVKQWPQQQALSLEKADQT